MHGRHLKKAPRLIVFRSAVAFVLVLVLCFSSFATVLANTVSVNVVDGADSYSFSMTDTDLDDILARAQEQGMSALGTLDVAEWVEDTTTVIVRRGVSMKVLEAGQEISLTAYRGDAVGKTLQDNSILLSSADECEPATDSVVEGSLIVTIRRSCNVTVTADGATKKLTLTGKTVGDALREAGVTLGKDDTVNFGKDEPLFDKMNIRVTRPTTVKLTVDGETKEHSLSASSVAEALKKLNVTLGDEDVCNVSLQAKLTDEMEIIVRRGKTQEVTVTEAVDYETSYEDTESLYEGETETKTEGVPGEREVTYKITYLDGEEIQREALSEKVVKEPVSAVVYRGTAQRPQEDISSGGSSGGSSSGGIGTFIDMYGNEVSYSNLFVGDCTAYSVPGGTTSLGWDAVYGVIAVNPNIIPYGTKMYVTSPDGSVVYGYGVAGDTGGACMEGRIIADLCYNTIEECSIIGRRTMNVYILS